MNYDISKPRIQILDYQDPSFPELDQEVIGHAKLNPNRWVSVKDKNGSMQVVRWFDPTALSEPQKSQYQERKNNGWFDVQGKN